jgi:hypothetical protein
MAISLSLKKKGGRQLGNTPWPGRLHPPPRYDRGMFTSKIFKTLDTETAEVTQFENLKTGEDSWSESLVSKKTAMKTGKHHQSESLESEAIVLLSGMLATIALRFPSYRADSFTGLSSRRHSATCGTGLNETLMILSFLSAQALCVIELTIP